LSYHFVNAWRVLLLCGALFAAPLAHAEPSPTNTTVPSPSPVVVAGKPTPPDIAIRPLVWRGRRFSTMDYAVTALGATLTLTAAIVSPRAQHSLSGGILFDEAARDALRVHGLQARYVYRDASDVGLSLAVTWPFFADSLTAAWWYRGSRDVAQEMALIDLEALAISGGLQGVTNVFVSRERPYGRDCGSSSLPSTAVDCSAAVHYRSFFSGHSAFSFTSAALVCTHHFENGLLGPPWDALSCLGAYAVAGTTATFRVVSDVHYASDVLTGALLGTLVGYGVPLLHYRHPHEGSARTDQLRMSLVPAAGGIGILGIF
jgi:membrane-associated phospholipid phosphatase